MLCAIGCAGVGCARGPLWCGTVVHCDGGGTAGAGG